MANGQLNFPPEIMDAVSTMEKAAQAIDSEMQQLKGVVNGLVTSSKGAAISAYNDAQNIWNQMGVLHNETLNNLAKEAGNSYTNITDFDNYVARQLQNG